MDEKSKVSLVVEKKNEDPIQLLQEFADQILLVEWNGLKVSKDLKIQISSLESLATSGKKSVLNIKDKIEDKKKIVDFASAHSTSAHSTDSSSKDKGP